MFAVCSQVTHLLPANKTNLDDYILLHPDAAKYIWFPDIYIGKQSIWSVVGGVVVYYQYIPDLKWKLKNICVWGMRSLRGQFIVICCNNF